ncbi:MAG TPA: ribonuclease HI [Candidatus Paceibacterota bacterium]|nr:ribonuclease HI [Candidatus Paceibacterota bacterium]HRZ34275.1 ribonuclease HI [Candidatus Paceibacterota bacterium]
MISKILIYTDGASRGNPGPGGYGAIIIEGKNVEEIGDGETKTTNNRMEISAALNAIKKTPVGSKIRLFTDSGYLINGITKWVHGWLKNGWKTSDKKDVLNKDLWQKLYKVAVDREIEWLQVKGHAGVSGNNRADEIATGFGDGERVLLFKGDIGNYKIDLSEPGKEALSENSERERKNARAYSYLSLIDGKLSKHTNWSECEARVKGKAGAKFRKTISAEDELEILRSWGIKR